MVTDPFSESRDCVLERSCPCVYPKPVLGFSVHWLCLALSLFPFEVTSSTMFCHLFSFQWNLGFLVHHNKEIVLKSSQDFFVVGLLEMLWSL